jgi:uncharacterized protein (TIGR02271 family)
MTFESSTGMTPRSRGTGTRTITAFFDNRDDAQEAVDAVRATGVESSDIEMIEGSRPGSDAGDRSSMSSERPYHEEGFWASLANLFMPDDDRYTYAEGLRRGGYLVTVTTDSDEYDRILDILDREGTVDLDERAEGWRSSGWAAPDTAGASLGGEGGALATGSLAGSTGAAGGMGAAGGTGSMRDSGDLRGAGVSDGGLGDTAGTSGLAGRRSTSATGTTSGMAGASTTDRLYDEASAGARRDAVLGEDRNLDAGNEQVIPIAEERLNIGKREVNQGRVRVRSYVVERPVEEDVRLREERVALERRPADRAVSGTADPFRERTLEVEQRGEEAVVSKDARITEEVVVGKTDSYRTEKVEDRLRRTEVEIEDERSGRSAGGTVDPIDERDRRRS